MDVRQTTSNFNFNADIIAYYLQFLEANRPDFYTSLLAGNVTGRLFYPMKKDDEVESDFISEIEAALSTPSLFSAWEKNLQGITPELLLPTVFKVKEIVTNLFQNLVRSPAWFDFIENQKDKIKNTAQLASLEYLIAGALTYKSLAIWATGRSDKTWVVALISPMFIFPPKAKEKFDELEKKWRDRVQKNINQVINFIHTCENSNNKNWPKDVLKKLNDVYADPYYLFLGKKSATILIQSFHNEIALLAAQAKTKFLLKLSNCLLETLQTHHKKDLENLLHHPEKNHTLLCYLKILFEPGSAKIKKQQKELYDFYKKCAKAYKIHKAAEPEKCEPAPELPSITRSVRFTLNFGTSDSGPSSRSSSSDTLLVDEKLRPKAKLFH